VTRTSTADADVLTAVWKDGRIGTVRAIRPYSGYGAVVFRAKRILQSREKAPFSYRPLVGQIVQFFETGKPPVPNAETLETIAFMEAAQRSKAQGGSPVRLQEESSALPGLLHRTRQSRKVRSRDANIPLDTASELDLWLYSTMKIRSAGGEQAELFGDLCVIVLQFRRLV
jgi:hypothetical protein